MVAVGVVDPRLVALVVRYGEEEGCRRYLEALRWPHGPECPRCGAGEPLWLQARRKYSCRSCKYQFRVSTGTLLHDSHLPLAKWLLAVSVMLAGERRLPATQLQQILGGGYKTSWFLEHRIRAAMEVVAPVGAVPVAFAPTVPANASRTASGDSELEAPASWRVLRRLIADSPGHLSAKHLSAYWNEVLWREANAGNPHAFRDTVAALLRHAPVPYARLTAADATRAECRRS